MFDTSVIVSGITESHPHFSVSHPWILAVKAKKFKACISTHCLAEVFTTLTRTGFNQPSLTSRHVEQVLTESVRPYFENVTLVQKDYHLAINRVASQFLQGPIIYDALHVQAALKKKVEAIVTLNEKDFNRLIKPGEIKIINPLSTSPR